MNDLDQKSGICASENLVQRQNELENGFENLKTSRNSATRIKNLANLASSKNKPIHGLEFSCYDVRSPITKSV